MLDFKVENPVGFLFLCVFYLRSRYLVYDIHLSHREHDFCIQIHCLNLNKKAAHGAAFLL